MASDPARSELDLVAAALQRLRPGLDDGVAARLRGADWSAGRVEEGGQFHRVLVLEDVGVLRMTRAHEAGAAPAARWTPERDPAVHLPRRLALLDGLAAVLAEAGVRWSLPTALSAVVEDGPGAAVLQRYVPGFPHPPHEGDPAVLRGVLADLAAVDVADPRVAPHLGRPFAFRGPWTPERAAHVAGLPARLAPRLGAWPGDALGHAGDETAAGEAAVRLRADAWGESVTALTGVVSAWTREPPVPPALVHGDLAGHNMRWRAVPAAATPDAAAPDAEVRWELAGVLDWDLACAWDPALNVAYLGLWHGEDLVEAIAADPAEARRARVWLGAMALETLDDAGARDVLVGGLAESSWRRLLRKTLPRVGRALVAAAA